METEIGVNEKEKIWEFWKAARKSGETIQKTIPFRVKELQLENVFASLFDSLFE